jgi:hypothetical protein
MRKQLRECRTQNEIRERLKVNAGIIKENTGKEKEELIDLSGFTMSDLKELIRSSVNDYFDETFDTEPTYEDWKEDDDVELQKIIDELEIELG